MNSMIPSNKFFDSLARLEALAAGNSKPTESTKTTGDRMNLTRKNSPWGDPKPIVAEVEGPPAPDRYAEKYDFPDCPPSYITVELLGLIKGDRIGIVDTSFGDMVMAFSGLEGGSIQLTLPAGVEYSIRIRQVGMLPLETKINASGRHSLHRVKDLAYNK